MNILLVFPSSRVAGWGSSRIGGNLDGCFRPNGITMIGSMLRHEGHTVTPLDFREYDNWEEVTAKFLSDKWDVVCAGWLSAETPNAEQFIKIVREHDKDVYIICGGIHLTVSGIKEMEGVDTIIHGEADYAVLEAIKERAPYIYSMPVQNLDELPFPDRTLFSPYEKTTAFLPLLELPFASVMFGRGCPYGTVRSEKLEDGRTVDTGCKYCYRSSFSQSFNKHRNHSPERCVTDLLRLKADYGELGSYMIHDDIFPLSDDWVKRFIESYDSNIKERIPFWCQMRADQINRFESKGLMSELARIGLTWVSLGWETGSARLLEFIGKGVTVEENDKSVEVLHSHHINIFLNYIRHLPTETMEDIKITVDKLKQINPSYHAASTYTDYPGTVMNKYCKDNNLLLEEHYSTLRYPYEPRIKNVDYDGEGHELWVSALGFKREPMVWRPAS